MVVVRFEMLAEIVWLVQAFTVNCCFLTRKRSLCRVLGLSLILMLNVDCVMPLLGKMALDFRVDNGNEVNWGFSCCGCRGRWAWCLARYAVRWGFLIFLIVTFSLLFILIVNYRHKNRLILRRLNNNHPLADKLNTLDILNMRICYPIYHQYNFPCIRSQRKHFESLFWRNHQQFLLIWRWNVFHWWRDKGKGNDLNLRNRLVAFVVTVQNVLVGCEGCGFGFGVCWFGFFFLGNEWADNFRWFLLLFDVIVICLNTLVPV